MSDALLTKVLSCRTLPSLPAVALQVLELTRDPGVNADKLAAVLQGDPGLASKLLKTVNSSFYGLSQPCASISKAVGLMGLNAVKSLALGFSLIETASASAEGGFDLLSYWRRAVYSGAAARILAKQTKAWDAEEAFTAALLQDIGMLAIRAALKADYDAVIASAPPDHGDLCQHERDRLGFDHAHVGAELARRWRLPAQLVDATRLHHAEEPAEGPSKPLTEIMQVSCLAALAIVADTGYRWIDVLRARMQRSFGLDAEATDAFLKEVSTAGSQLSLLLKVNTGQKPDVSAILDEARERLTVHQETLAQHAAELQHQNTELVRKASTDALTGACNRRTFDDEAQRMFAEAVEKGTPLSVAFSDADKFKSVNDTYGHQAGDAVLIELSKRLRVAIGDKGLVCRYGGEEFAVLMPGADIEASGQLGEAMRAAMESSPVNIAHLKLKVPELKVTISVGLATFEPAEVPRKFEAVAQLVHAADEGVYAAKQGGRNRVARVEPGHAAPAGGTAEGAHSVETGANLAGATKGATQTIPTVQASAAVSLPAADAGASAGGTAASKSGAARQVLLVEEDALAAKLLEAVLVRVPGVKLSWVRSAPEALKRATAAGGVPDLVITNIAATGAGPTGLDLARGLRANATTAQVPIVAISADEAPALAQQATSAGANMFSTKSHVCANLAAWVKQSMNLCENKAA